MNGYLSYNGLQRFWSKVKGYIDNKFNEASSTTPKQTYSTEEHVVGTWIDGRDIYEKTYSLLITMKYSSPSFEGTLEEWERNDLPIDKVISFSGAVNLGRNVNSSDNRSFTWESITNDGFSVGIRSPFYAADKPSLIFAIYPRAQEELVNGFSDAPLIITIQYVKR